MKSIRKALAAKARVVPTEVDKQERSIVVSGREHAAEFDKWANLPPEILGSIFGRLKHLAVSNPGGVFSCIKTCEV